MTPPGVEIYRNVTAFIDQVVSTRIPELSDDPLQTRLRWLVTKVSRHRHVFICAFDTASYVLHVILATAHLTSFIASSVLLLTTVLLSALQVQQHSHKPRLAKSGLVSKPPSSTPGLSVTGRFY